MGKLAAMQRKDQLLKPVVDLYLVLDFSRSMSQDGRLDSLNTALKELLRKLPKQAEEENIELFVNIVSFSSRVDWIFKNEQLSSGIKKWKDKTNKDLGLLTHTGNALDEINKDIVSKDVLGHRAPVIILLSDGKVGDNDTYNSVLSKYNGKDELSKTIRAAILVGNQVLESQFDDFVSDASNLYKAGNSLDTIVQKVCKKCVSSSTMSTVTGSNDREAVRKYGLL